MAPRSAPPKRVRIRPTAHAAVVLAVVLGAAPAAAVGLGVAWVVVAAGVGLLLVAPWLAHRQVAAVRAMDAPDRMTLHAGRTKFAPFVVQLHRTTRHLVVGLSDGRDPDESREARTALAIAKPHEGPGPGHELRIGLAVRASRRGRVEALRCSLRSSFPFGLFEARAILALRCDVSVLPRTVRTPDRRIQRALAARVAKLEPARPRPRARTSGLPVSVRQARQGDTARDIAWRESFRKSRWLTRERSAPESVVVSVDLVVPGYRRLETAAGPRGSETRALADARAVEAAISLTGSLVTRLAAAHQRRVRLRVLGTDREGSHVLAEVSSRRPRAILGFLTSIPGVDSPAEVPESGSPLGSRGSAVVVYPVGFGAELERNPLGTTKSGSLVLFVDSAGRVRNGFASTARSLVAVSATDEVRGRPAGEAQP